MCAPLVGAHPEPVLGHPRDKSDHPRDTFWGVHLDKTRKWLKALREQLFVLSETAPWSIGAAGLYFPIDHPRDV